MKQPIHPHGRMKPSLHEGSPNLNHPEFQPSVGMPIAGVAKPPTSIPASVLAAIAQQGGK